MCKVDSQSVCAEQGFNVSDYVCYLCGNIRAEYAFCLEYGKNVVYFVADRSDLDVFCLEVCLSLLHL